MPTVYARLLDLPKIPDNLPKCAEAFLDACKQELLAGPPPESLVLFTISQGRPLRWDLLDAPSPPDDLIRAAVHRESAFVCALLYPAPVPPNVQADRCWIVSSEDQENRLELMVALRGTTPSGGAEQVQLLASPMVAASPRWVGQEPEDLTLFEEETWGGPVGDA